ncbi:MAG: gluconate 2-dehydrogenase subunit 3 family protein [Pseudomonadota bacterium]
MSYTRRRFVRHAGVGALSFFVAGCRQELTPAEARDQGIAFQILSAEEVGTLEVMGDALVPGSAAAGIAHFIDHQLAAPAAEQLLMIKYLGVPAPYVDFYRGGLRGARLTAQAIYGKPAAELSSDEATDFVGKIAGGSVEDWEGPPAGFFYFVLRADAVDVVYGTPQGFADLGVPYMAHIEPPSRWGE